jgi:hypothetical protein
LHMSWHPFEDSIAIAATNNVGIASICYWISLTHLSCLSSRPCKPSVCRRNLLVILSAFNTWLSSISSDALVQNAIFCSSSRLFWP